MKVREAPFPRKGNKRFSPRRQETQRPQRNILINLGVLCVSWRRLRESGSQPQPQHVARRSNGISTTYGVLSRVRAAFQAAPVRGRDLFPFTKPPHALEWAIMRTEWVSKRLDHP